MTSMTSRRLLAVVVLLLAGGCAVMRAARAPMELVTFRDRGPAQARGAIVLLPGFGDDPDAFHDNGFVQMLAQKAPDYDVYAADAHFGYYRTRTLLARLQRDVFAPLRARGYRELWLVGASLGGFGAVGYARTHPEGVAGLLLFAPYMGPNEVVQEVSAIGLCNFDAQPETEDSEANFARANFAWLKRQACDERKLPLFLAVGLSDRMLVPDRLLGTVLDPAHVVVLPGGHGWKVWTPALERLAPLAFDKNGPSH